jgi:hypothetical protein
MEAKMNEIELKIQYPYLVMYKKTCLWNGFQMAETFRAKSPEIARDIINVWNSIQREWAFEILSIAEAR